MSKRNELTPNSIELSSKTKKENNRIINWLKKVKSSFILKKIFAQVNKREFMKIIFYIKSLQRKMNLSIADYKFLSTIDIELEIEPAFTKKKNKNYFLHYLDDKSYFYRIYFDEGINEIKRNYVTPDVHAKKIFLLSISIYT